MAGLLEGEGYLSAGKAFIVMKEIIMFHGVTIFTVLKLAF